MAVLSFPINMAYAMVAGLPISYGIFGGIVASLIGLFLCKSTYITLGPSNATSVMLLSSFAAAGLLSEEARCAALPNILVVAGIIMVLVSLFKLTFFVSYISRTVIVAYITSASLLIVANQMKNMLGFSYPEGCTPITLIDTVSATVKSLSGAKWESVLMAGITLAVFLPMKKFFKKLPAEGLTLIIMGAVCWAASQFWDINAERLTAVKASGWNFSAPDFSAIGFKDTLSMASAIVILAIIEACSIGKSLAAQKADRIDVNQEIFALGVANAACAVSSSSLASGSLTRSTLAVISGAKTTLFNLFTALFMIAAILLFGDAIAFVPKATLALIVVYTSITLIKPHVIKVALKSTYSDAIVFLSTFCAGVFGSLDDAIFTGVVVSIGLFLKKASTPEVIEFSIGDDGELEMMKSHKAAEVSIVHVEGNMFFGASDVIQKQVRRIAAEPDLKVLILKLRNAINFDATSVMDMEELATRMAKTGKILMVCEVRPDVMRVLKGSGIYDMVGADNIFENDEQNPTLSAARAVKASLKYLGKNPKVSIYATEEVK